MVETVRESINLMFDELYSFISYSTEIEMKQLLLIFTWLIDINYLHLLLKYKF